MILKLCDCCGENITAAFGFEITIPDGEVSVKDGKVQSSEMSDETVTLDICFSCLEKLYGGLLNKPINNYKVKNKGLYELETF